MQHCSIISHPWQSKILIGNIQVQTYLQRLFINQFLPKVLLLVGIKGIGKATLAYQIAGWLLQVADVYKNTDLFVCDSTFPDRRQIVIEDIRQIKDFVKHTNLVSSSNKVIIIDAIEDANKQAQNALLKLLEEYSHSTYFILICHRLHLVLKPLLSRCTRINFQSLDGTELAQILQQLGLESATTFIPAASGSISQLINAFYFDGYTTLVEIIAQQMQGQSSPELGGFILKISENIENYYHFCSIYNSLWYRLFNHVFCKVSQNVLMPNLLLTEQLLVDLMIKNQAYYHYFKQWQAVYAELNQNMIGLNVTSRATLVLYALSHPFNFGKWS